jgi:hypothetical protein
MPLQNASSAELKASRKNGVANTCIRVVDSNVAAASQLTSTACRPNPAQGASERFLVRVAPLQIWFLAGRPQHQLGIT